MQTVVRVLIIPFLHNFVASSKHELTAFFRTVRECSPKSRQTKLRTKEMKVRLRKSKESEKKTLILKL